MLTIKEIVIDGLTRDLNAPVDVRNTEGKGRGVFATTTIPKHTYVCEYKTTGVYTKEQHMKRYQEMAANDEVCAVVEYKVGRSTLFFDATRRINQYDRFMNHGRKNANVKMFHSLGMYTVTEISPEEELLWDYGIKKTEMPWESK